MQTPIWETTTREHDASRTLTGGVRVLVMSQHEAVRRQLVAYLHRSNDLAVAGDELSRESIEQARPDVLVLDLSRIGPDGLRQAVEAVQQVGAGLIALASLRVAAEERAVVDAGGLYRLKSAGADGLADLVAALATSSARERLS
jgi:chemotaxis response regulator CheB